MWIVILDPEKRPPWKDKAWKKWTRAVCVQFLFVSVPEVFYFFMSAKISIPFEGIAGCDVFVYCLVIYYFFRAKGSSVWLTA